VANPHIKPLRKPAWKISHELNTGTQYSAESGGTFSGESCPTDCKLYLQQYSCFAILHKYGGAEKQHSPFNQVEKDDGMECTLITR